MKIKLYNMGEKSKEVLTHYRVLLKERLAYLLSKEHCVDAPYLGKTLTIFTVEHDPEIHCLARFTTTFKGHLKWFFVNQFWRTLIFMCLITVIIGAFTGSVLAFGWILGSIIFILVIGLLIVSTNQLD